MLFLNAGILAVVASAVWWLTGIDKTASGESKRGEYLPRALRCVAVLFLTAMFLWLLEKSSASYGDVSLIMILPVTLALKLFAQGFLGLLDPTLHDHRALDLRKSQRHADEIAYLVHHGKREEAIKLS